MSGTLVVGASGALRPAAVELARTGRTVIAVGRSARRLADLAAIQPTIRPTPTDYTDLQRLADDLPPGPYEAALLYCPHAPLSARKLLAERTHGPVVELLTSAAADPGLVGADLTLADLPTVGTVRVLLGWADGPRWHTPSELALAALAALADGQDRILGRVRPWDERP